MDYSMMFDSSPASRLPMKPTRGPAGREAANGSFADVPRALLTAGILVLMVALSGNAGYARDRLPGDVERLAMIGFTVADVDRETTFFTKVLSFEKVSDFRVIGSEYDKMEGVFNTNMRIVHLKLGEQIVELTQYISPPTGRPIPVPSYSNDEWFEHMAIVVRDMDAAYKILQDNSPPKSTLFPYTIPFRLVMAFAHKTPAAHHLPPPARLVATFSI